MTPKQWKGKVASLGCILCRHLDLGETPANLHHIREGVGMSQRASDWLVVPLYREHHQGKTGVHGAQFYQLWKLDELDLLAMTLAAIV
jgi:predicted secreted protein